MADWSLASDEWAFKLITLPMSFAYVTRPTRVFPLLISSLPTRCDKNDFVRLKLYGPILPDSSSTKTTSTGQAWAATSFYINIKFASNTQWQEVAVNSQIYTAESVIFFRGGVGVGVVVGVQHVLENRGPLRRGQRISHSSETISVLWDLFTAWYLLTRLRHIVHMNAYALYELKHDYSDTFSGVPKCSEIQRFHGLWPDLWW